MKLNRLMLAGILSLSLSATSAYACENGSGGGDRDHSWTSFWHRCFHGQDDDRNHDGDHDRDSDHNGGGCHHGGSGSGGSTSGSGGGSNSGGSGSTSGGGAPYK